MFWQVGSSATLGTSSAFTGSILALTSISVNTGDTIDGRALARNGAVTLDDDTITVAYLRDHAAADADCDHADLYDLCDAHADQARADADLYDLCDSHADQARADADADRHEPAPGAYSDTRPHPLPGDRLRIAPRRGPRLHQTPSSPASWARRRCSA